VEEFAMSRFADKIAAQWQDAVNLVLGLWLIVSPWILAYAAEQIPSRNAIVAGVIIAVAAAAALFAFRVWEERVNVALATWLIASPGELSSRERPRAYRGTVISGLRRISTMIFAWARCPLCI
jgi:SPW repeat